MSEFEKSEKMEKEKIGEETALVSPVGCRTEMMMNLRLWMVALFLLAAIGLLGGCAQSSGDADPDTEDDTTMMDDMDDDDEMVDDDDEMVDDDEEMMDERGPYQVAVEERNKAEDADMMATAALKEARDLSVKLDVLSVKGESMTAMENAQKILDAQTTVEGALADAKEALAALEVAKEGADEDATAELDDIIAIVKMKIENIEKILDAKGEDALAQIIEDKVTGDVEDELKTAADKGIEVAEAIEAALKIEARVMAGDNAPADIDEAHRTMSKDQPGVTWSEIVGTTMDANIIGSDDVLEAVKVVSINGETVATTDSDLDATAENEMEAYGTQGIATHKGIVGTAICLGSDCVVAGTGDNRMLTGSWYFTPTDAEKLYVADTAAPGMYMEDMLYTEYGYWLTQNSDGLVTVHTYAKYGVAATPTNPGEIGAEDTLAASAEYKGPAIGMSVYRLGEDVRSGHFDADVSLTVEFGTSPMISGNVSNFRGNAVNENWNVELRGPSGPKAEFANAGTLEADSETFTTNNTVNGKWAATSYGATDERPTGIFGTFNANFVDGNAAGAYATRKE